MNHIRFETIDKFKVPKKDVNREFINKRQHTVKGKTCFFKSMRRVIVERFAQRFASLYSSLYSLVVCYDKEVC